MSTLNVSNITDGTTTVGTSYVVNGSAKAWVHFNTSISTTIYSPSLNISSLTDHGSGNTTVTMINAFTGTSDYNTCGADDFYGMCNCGETSGRSASAFKVYNYNSSFGLVDCNNISVSMFGDLA